MNRVLYTSFLLGAGLTCIKGQTNTPPNIVLILCDDMGFSDLVVTEVKSGPPTSTVLPKTVFASACSRIQEEVAPAVLLY